MSCSNSPFSTFVCPVPFNLSGSNNTYAYVSGSYFIITITENGSIKFTNPNITNVNYILVGSGGNGGDNYFNSSNNIIYAGGGGAGGQVINSSFNVNTSNPLNFSFENGSTICANGSTTITAYNGETGGNATESGPGIGGSNYAAGGNGGSSPNNQQGTAGSNGVPIEINGTTYFFGAGGAGGCGNTDGTTLNNVSGGIGGGGGSGTGYESNNGLSYYYTNGNITPVPSINGYANTGGGGSGADCVPSSSPGTGGSGIAIIYFEYKTVGPTGSTNTSSNTGATGSDTLPFSLLPITSTSFQYVNGHYILTFNNSKTDATSKCSNGTIGSVEFNVPISNANIICVGAGGGGTSGWGEEIVNGVFNSQSGCGGGAGGCGQVSYEFGNTGTYITFVGAGGIGGPQVNPGSLIQNGTDGNYSIIYDVNDQNIIYSVGGQGGATTYGGIGNSSTSLLTSFEGGNGGNGGILISNGASNGNSSVTVNTPLTIPSSLSSYILASYGGGGAAGTLQGGQAGINGLGGQNSIVLNGQTTTNSGAGGGGGGSGNGSSNISSAGGDGADGILYIYFEWPNNTPPFSSLSPSISYIYENGYFVITCVNILPPTTSAQSTSGSIKFTESVENAYVISVGAGGGGSPGWGEQITNIIQMGGGGGGGAFCQININFEAENTYDTYVGAGGQGGLPVNPGTPNVNGYAGGPTYLALIPNTYIYCEGGQPGSNSIGGNGGTIPAYVPVLQGGAGGQGGSANINGSSPLGSLTNIPISIIEMAYGGGGAGGSYGGGGAGLTDGLGGLINYNNGQPVGPQGGQTGTYGSGGGAAGIGNGLTSTSAAGGNGGDGIIIIYFPYPTGPTGTTPTGPTGPTGTAYATTTKFNFYNITTGPTGIGTSYDITVDEKLSYIPGDTTIISLPTGPSGPVSFLANVATYTKSNGNMTVDNFSNITSQPPNEVKTYNLDLYTAPTGPTGPTGITGPNKNITCFPELCKTVNKDKTINLQGSFTIPGYTTPPFKLCVWDLLVKPPVCFPNTTTDFPGVELWPTTDWTIALDIYLSFIIEAGPSSESFSVTTTTPSKPQEASKILVENVTLNLSVSVNGGPTTKLLPVALVDSSNKFFIEQSNNCPGYFTVNIPFDSYKYEYDGYGFNITNNLTMTLDPSDDQGWMNYNGSASISAFGYTTSASYSAPIIAVTNNN